MVGLKESVEPDTNDASLDSARLRRRRLRTRVAIAITGLLAVCGFFVFGTSFEWYKPTKFSPTALNRAVAWVTANGGLDREGYITLPPSLSAASMDGKAYVSDGSIFFPSLWGRRTLLPDPLLDKSSWVEGYTYSLALVSEPGPNSDGPSGEDGFSEFDLDNPAHAANDSPKRPLFIGGRIEGNWYFTDSFS